ncbi:hypothetical protein D3C87_1315370 [compost metagenome]
MCTRKIVDIFQQRTKFNGVKDLWLLFSSQVYAFGVAAAFKVKYAVFAPAMLVITNQATFRISRKGSFTRSR